MLGNFQEIANITQQKEYSRKCQKKKLNRALPWDEYSVKQFRGEHHYHGKQSFQEDFSTQLLDKSYMKPPPESLRFSDAWPSSSELPPKSSKRKISPWVPTYQSTQYTAHGTLLDDFKKKELNRKVDKYLKEYVRRKRENDEHHLRKSLEILPEEMIHETVSKNISDGIIEVKKDILRKNFWYDKFKSAEIAVDSVATLDLDEACFRGNVVMVSTLLAAGKSPADSDDDDPLFNRCFEKALALDTKENSLFLGDKESKARQDLDRILHLLYKAGADINAFGASTRLAPIHRAAITGNVKMLLWLLERGADLSLRGRRERLTAAQFAARQGNVFFLAEIVRERDLTPLMDADASGRNSLHVASLYGQTDAAEFLLSIGIDKRIKDNTGLSAGDLAHNAGHEQTALVVRGFSADPPDPRPLLQYITDARNRELSNDAQFVQEAAVEDDSFSISSALLNMKSGANAALRHVMSYLNRSLHVTSEKL